MVAPWSPSTSSSWQRIRGTDLLIILGLKRRVSSFSKPLAPFAPSLKSMVPRYTLVELSRSTPLASMFEDTFFPHSLVTKFMSRRLSPLHRYPVALLYSLFLPTSSVLTPTYERFPPSSSCTSSAFASFSRWKPKSSK